MSVGKIGTSAVAWAWGHIENGFFQFIERKIKEGEKKYPPVHEIRRKWMNFSWGTAAAIYRKHLQEYYGQFSVFGMGEVKITKLFTDVFLLDTSLPNNLFEHSGRDEKPISGLRLVRGTRGHRLFIWGEPGSGKTTFLKSILHDFLEKRPDIIPIFVGINEWENSTELSWDGLLNHISKQFEFLGFPNADFFLRYILEEGLVIVLFDGLDEIQEKHRTAIDKTLDSFCRNPLTSKTQCLITCRFEGTKHEYDNFTHVRIAPWDNNRINSFIHKRFRDKDIQEGFLTELEKPTNTRLSEFTRTPLLLTLLCAAFRPTGKFPAKKALIYQEAISHLIQERDNKRSIVRDEIIQGITKVQITNLYSQLAYQSFVNGQQTFDQFQLENQIAEILSKIMNLGDSLFIQGEKVLSSLVAQHGFLTKKANRTYSFSHLTFQEYFAAKYIIDNTEKGTFEDLMGHAAEQRWREVILLTSSLLPEATKFFEALQRSSENLIPKEELLLEIQEWATRKSLETEGYSAPAKRSLYWYLALGLGLESRSMRSFIVKNISTPDDAVPNVHKIIYRFLLEHNPELAQAYELPASTAYDLCRKLDNTISQTLDLGMMNYIEDNIQFHKRRLGKDFQKIWIDVRTTYLLLLRPIVYYVHKDIATRFIDNRYRSDICDLSEALAIITGKAAYSLYGSKLLSNIFPKGKIKSRYFNKVGLDIFARDNFDIGITPLLNSNQYNLVYKYLVVNLLLVDCLEIAYVTDREQIKNKILTITQ